MRIRKSTLKNKKLIITIAVVLVASLGGYAAFAATGQLWPFATDTVENVDYSIPTKEQQEAGDTTSDQAKDNANSDDDLPEKDDDQPTDYTDEGKVNVSITSANQNNGQLQIRTLIETVASGRCALTLSGSHTVTREADTQALASSSTCQGFDVPISELSPGTWDIKINYRDNNNTGSAQKTITIE